MTDQPPPASGPRSTIVTLVVDDDADMREMLRRVLSAEGHAVLEAANGAEALQSLERERVDVVLSDVRMPGLDGMALLQATQRVDPDLPVVLMTAFGSVEDAVAAMKAGAADYVRKPFELGEVVLALKRAVASARMKREVERLRARSGEIEPIERLIGQSEPMRELKALIRRVSDSDANVIVSGESGTGKELVAQAIHACSGRAEGPLVAVNCSAVPETLFESEFFGYVKGAFTGAVQSRPGLFEEADGGTLFLDEVSVLAGSCQAKLLRVLEEGRVKRVGATKAHPVDVRIIAATNVALEQAVESGVFRSDLFYRLNVVTLRVPPLRDRIGDVPLLVRHSLSTMVPAGDPVPEMTPEASDLLMAYAWPGNVRELQNVLQRALVLRGGEPIRPADLPPFVLSGAVVPDRGAAPAAAASSEAGAGTGDTLPSLEELERAHIMKVLEATGGNRSRAAERLGIDRRTLHRKLKRFEEQL